MTQNNQVALQLGRDAAYFLNRLAHGKMPGDGKAFRLHLRHPLIEHLLCAFFFLIEQFLGEKSFGKKHA